MKILIHWLISNQTKPSRMISDVEKLELYYLRKASMQFQQLREVA